MTEYYILLSITQLREKLKIIVNLKTIDWIFFLNFAKYILKILI